MPRERGRVNGAGVSVLKDADRYELTDEGKDQSGPQTVRVRQRLRALPRRATGPFDSTDIDQADDVSTGGLRFCRRRS